MANDTTKIRWTTHTWNPTRGCQVVSPGCTNCYAMAVAYRFSRPGGPYEGLAEKRNGHPVWTGKVRLMPEKLAEPLAWQRQAERSGDPVRVFVDSMSDLFHPDVPFTFIDRVFDVMEACPSVTFQILTKRPERMRDYMWLRLTRRFIGHLATPMGAERLRELCRSEASVRQLVYGYLPNSVWLGTSIEDQRRADERVPILLQTPAAVRFLSCEPLLSAIDLRQWLGGSQDENQRNGSSVDVRNRHANRGSRGSHLATPGDYEGERDWGQGDTVRTQAGGYGAVVERRLSTNPSDDWQGAVRSPGTPDRLDAVESANDPGRLRCEPQGRKEGQQSARESGVGDASGERSACAACSPADQRAESPWREVNGGAGLGDRSSSETRDHVESGDCSAFRRDNQDGAEYPDASRVAGAFSARNIGISWVIAGGESGPRFRPMDQAWARTLRNQCVEAGVAFFYKQGSGIRTEMDTSLHEEDGTLTTWEQYPDEMGLAPSATG